MEVTTFQSIQQSLAPELERLNQSIGETLHSPNPLMNSVISTYLEKKGKQVRPLIVLLTARLLTGSDAPVGQRVIDGAAAVELLHNASLIHDDVVDDARQRRGAPTINGLWDNHLAVLVGDFFLSNALLRSVATGDLRIMGSISNLGRLLAIGELDEIYNARYNELDEPTYYKIIYRKTASLFVSCVEVGAYAVGVPALDGKDGKDANEGGDGDEPAGDTRLDALREFARLLGLCFQVKDDVFDYGSAQAIGKPAGNDLREGKITLPLLHVLETLSGEENDRMRRLVRQEFLSPQEVAELIDYAVAHGGIDYAYAEMERLRDRAVELLEANFADCPARQALCALISFIITRSH